MNGGLVRLFALCGASGGLRVSVVRSACPSSLRGRVPAGHRRSGVASAAGEAAREVWSGESHPLLTGVVYAGGVPRASVDQPVGRGLRHLLRGVP